MASYWPLWPYDTTVEPDTTVAILLLAMSTGLRGRLAGPAIIAQTGFLLILLNSITGLSFGVTYFGGELAPMALVGTLFPWAAGMFLYRVWGMPDDDFQIEGIMIANIMGSTIILSIVSSYQHQVADELREAAGRRLAELAVTDGLTGLRNRAGLTQVLCRRMMELRHTGKSVGIALFDLDHFKRVNDTHGHDEGDRVLVNVGRAFAPLLRQGDVLGRWGSEEFMLIADLRQPEVLVPRVERLRIAMHDLSRQTGTHCRTGPFMISASFGVSELDRDDPSFDTAVKRADMALYKAKNGGRNRVVTARGYCARVA